jgi:hypothetical protein
VKKLLPLKLLLAALAAVALTSTSHAVSVWSSAGNMSRGIAAFFGF